MTFLNQISMSNKISSKVQQKDIVAKRILYNRSKNGLTSRIYGSQKRHSKRRGYTLPNYTLYELREWMFSQLNFEQLYNDWSASGYNKMLVPSCDRDDDYKPYTLDILKLSTWGENKNRYHQDAKNGINNKMAKAVIGTHIKTNNVIEFYSASEAQRQLGILQSSISACCLGKQKSYKGYTWKFKINTQNN